MNASAATVAPGVDEFALAGLTAAPCRLVRAPRVAESPAALECKMLDIVRLKHLDARPLDRFAVLGQVVGVHGDERLVTAGRFDTAAARPPARCGYNDYAAATEVFALLRPEERAKAR